MEKLQALSIMILLVQTVQSQVIPSHFNFSTLGILAANGSSATGRCSDVTENLDSLSTCTPPTSSVLFDGVIPTLTALDGDTWARQLMILQRPIIGDNSFSMYFNFMNTPSVGRIEVVLFNCPQWGIAVRRINVYSAIWRGTSYSSTRAAATVYPTATSCDSLVKVCIPLDIAVSSTIRFDLQPITSYIHVAEVAFYESSSPCPPFTTIPGNWTPTNEENEELEQSAATTLADIMPPGMQSSDVGCSCRRDTSLILSALAIIIALQTTVIFLVVLAVVVCKYNRRKATPKGPDTSIPMEMEEQLYEAVDTEEKSMAQKNPLHFK